MHTGYFEIPTSVFVGKVDLQMAPLPEIALYSSKDGKIEEIKKAGQPYSPLALTALTSVWIREEDFNQIRSFTDTFLDNPRLASTLSPESRMETLRKAAINVVDDLFQNPSPENITKSTKVVGSFVYVLMKDPRAYLYLAKLSSHDPYTLQHSVGTSVACIILAKKIGITDPKELQEVGMAGLLHDIGKVKVKREIINKNGPLDELEWEEMRQHSEEGWSIVKDCADLSERTKRAIREHHEDKNGTGYPHGLKYEQVDLFSKIVCICDVFNALTTNRSYSAARPPFEAFKMIREKLAHKIDEELFKSLVMVYGGNFDSEKQIAV